MLLPLSIALEIGIAYMVAWRVSSMQKKGMIVWFMVLTGAGVLLAFSGTVGVDPINGESYTAVDLIFPIVAGIVLGLAMRLPDALSLRMNRKTAVAASATPTTSNGGHAFNASASAVVGMNTEPPPAKGGLI